MKINEDFLPLVISPTEPVGNDRKKVWFRKGKNLFNKNVSIITGYLISDDGNMYQDEESWYQDVFIEVNSKTQYTISSTVALLRICFYDKDGKFISRKATTNTSVTFSTPENCKYVRLSGKYVNTQVQSLQLERGSTQTEYQPYVEPQIYIKNSYDVYEEFIKESEESFSITNYTGLISSVEIRNFQKKQISSSIYGYKLAINLIGNFTKNTEYRVLYYPFPFEQTGTIVREDNTHQIGSYIINSYGFWVNFSEDITASTANITPCAIMTNIGF